MIGPTSIKTPRSDGARLLAAFTTSYGDGVKCLGCGYPIPPNAYHECWRLTENGRRVTETKTLIPAETPELSSRDPDNG